MEDLRREHQQQLAALAAQLEGNTDPISIQKKTASNLFRYDGKQDQQGRVIDLSAFNKPLYLDREAETLEVQGLATYEDIVSSTVPNGFLPTVAPGFKQITIAGAIVGVAIESTCYRYGFVHDGLLEADVLLADGTIVTCSPDNQYADLFYGLGNSYGTLGYILRAKIRVVPVTPYVALHTERFNDTQSLLDAMEAATRNPEVEYIESATYTKDELYLTTGKQVREVPRLLNIYGLTIFYKEISRPGDVYLRTEDYVFRYDPEWFWGLPEGPLYSLFRLLAPKSLRNSGFYKRQYAAAAKRAAAKGVSPLKDDQEHLIQDWQVPWPEAKVLLDFALSTVDILGKPWLITPIVSPGKATSYPIKPDTLYFNLGCYTFARKQAGKEPYYNTKVMDAFCFARGGIKMLYSSTFISEGEFDRLYAGDARATLKQKYDPKTLLPTLYEKVARAA